MFRLSKVFFNDISYKWLCMWNLIFFDNYNITEWRLGLNRLIWVSFTKEARRPKVSELYGVNVPNLYFQNLKKSLRSISNFFLIVIENQIHDKKTQIKITNNLEICNLIFKLYHAFLYFVSLLCLYCKKVIAGRQLALGCSVCCRWQHRKCKGKGNILVKHVKELHPAYFDDLRC